MIEDSIVKWLTTLCTLLALSGPGLAGEGSPAQRLTDILAQTVTMSAEVEQLTLDQQGREVQASRARLTMHKPDRFHWQTLEPHEETLVTDGERLWIYEPDLEQVTIERFNPESSQTPAMLLSSDAETLSADFEIYAIDALEGRERFTLIPRRADALFEELSLTFHQGRLEEMQFEDSLGQRSSLVFEAVQVNEALDEGLFEFVIPEGIDVIDSSGR